MKTGLYFVYTFDKAMKILILVNIFLYGTHKWGLGDLSPRAKIPDSYSVSPINTDGNLLK